jgi:alpha-galactosidase
MSTPRRRLAVNQITKVSWVLETKNSAYVLALNQAGLLTHCYWGARLPALNDYPPPANPAGWASFNGAAQLTPEEYPAYSDIKYIEPCLKLSFADGVRTLDLHCESVEMFEDGIVVHLRDAHYPLRISLNYRAHYDYDLIERFTRIENLGAEPIHLERVFSGQWHLPANQSYRLSHLAGRWIDEMHVQRDHLTPGVKVLESRRITTSHHANPWFAIDRGNADETQGEVWFGLLEWSGNWKIAAEVTNFGSTRVNIGLNDWDFAWRINGGEAFESPACYGGYGRQGFGQVSHLLHDFIRDTVLPHGKNLHKVIYNSWEATTFNVDEASQTHLAEMAAEMGVELFVMDDGWFHGRNSDNAGLGDWWPDAAKFPNGLRPLVDQVNALGMDFGLWVEPEMVNPDSDLYRAHPDWVLHFPNRPRSEARNQLILNLARQDVQEYLFTHLDKLLSENNIAFIKWDMNRNASEAGWPTAPGDQRELWVRYVQGLYALWGRLRARHPHVVWQSCSGGGGRADLGILRLADQIWTSDNTEATARLAIQEGFLQLFPANTMEAWVTDAQAERIPLDFRFHVSMCGSLGVGGNLIHWGAEGRARAAELIAAYKAIRHIVQLGDCYRLHSAQQGAYSALQFVSKDRSESVLFVFRTYLPEPTILPRIYLSGLEPAASYRVDGLAAPRSGAAWMYDGLQCDLANFESRLIHIRRQP